MTFLIIFALIILLIISFYLALRSLSELEIPSYVLEQIKQGKTPAKFWGVIIFLKGKKTLHYSSSSSSTSSSGERSKAEGLGSSSKTSVKSSERIEV